MAIKALLLTGALSIAAYATEGPGSPTDGTGRSHASAPPACGDKCLCWLATVRQPAPGDHNGRSMASNTAAEWRPVLADDTGPINAGDHNGRSAALSQGGGEFLVAGGRVGGGGDIRS